MDARAKRSQIISMPGGFVRDSEYLDALLEKMAASESFKGKPLASLLSAIEQSVSRLQEMEKLTRDKEIATVAGDPSAAFDTRAGVNAMAHKEGKKAFDAIKGKKKVSLKNEQLPELNVKFVEDTVNKNSPPPSASPKTKPQKPQTHAERVVEEMKQAGGITEPAAAKAKSWTEIASHHKWNIGLCGVGGASFTLSGCSRIQGSVSKDDEGKKK